MQSNEVFDSKAGEGESSGEGARRSAFHGFETVYENNRFEVLRVGKDRFFLKLRGGLSYACPGLKKISKKEAEVLLAEHILEELRAGTRVIGMSEEEAAELMDGKLREGREVTAEREDAALGEEAQGADGHRC